MVSLAAMSRDDLPVVESAFPGALCDQLMAAILSGSKTTTTGLLADHEREGEPLPARAYGKPWLMGLHLDSACTPAFHGSYQERTRQDQVQISRHP